MMPETNLTEDRAQTKAFVDFRCSPSVVGGLQPQSIYFSAAVYILLSITTFLGNYLILVALHKESSLHPLSKLLYRCLATTDLLVGIFSQPIMATYWMFVVQENWSLCRYASNAAFILGYTLCGVSLSTMTAMSVDHAGLARAVKWNFVARCSLRLYSGNANKSTKQFSKWRLKIAF